MMDEDELENLKLKQLISESESEFLFETPEGFE